MKRSTCRDAGRALPVVHQTNLQGWFWHFGAKNVSPSASAINNVSPTFFKPGVPLYTPEAGRGGPAIPMQPMRTILTSIRMVVLSYTSIALLVGYTTTGETQAKWMSKETCHIGQLVGYKTGEKPRLITCLERDSPLWVKVNQFTGRALNTTKILGCDFVWK